MNNEFEARERTIGLRIAGQPVKRVCAVPGRCEAWFHRWWRRYLQAEPEGLYDLTRASHHVARHIPPEPERANLTGRRRGAGLVRVLLHRHYPADPIPTERTLQRWFRCAGLIPAPSGHRSGPRSYHRAQQPHEVWQMDAADQVALQNGTQVCWLRIADECSGAVLDAAKDYKPYAHPRYWAAFILIGDPE